MQPVVCCEIIHYTMSRNIDLKKHLTCPIQLLATPERFSEEIYCGLCDSTLSDPVEYIIVKCTHLINICEVMWDNISSILDSDFEGDLFNRAHCDILEILLGKS